MTMRWYVVHAYSGQEKSIQQALIDRIKRSGMAEKFGQVLVPTEEVVEMKSGQKALSERREHLVFMLWGGFAKKKKELIDASRHLVLEAAHPSPLAGGAFFGCRHFSQANEYLAKHGYAPIDWQIL